MGAAEAARWGLVNQVVTPEALLASAQALAQQIVQAAPLAVGAVLEGTVMGGGFGLACVADVAIASDTANFRLPETALGVIPAQIAPFLVERLGYSQAKRLAVTGGRLDARAALGQAPDGGRRCPSSQASARVQA